MAAAPGAAIEIELSAADFRDISLTSPPAPAPTPFPDALLAEGPGRMSVAALARKVGLRTALAVTFAAGAVLAIVDAQRYSVPPRPADIPIAHVSDPGANVISNVPPTQDAPLVRFANPFDRTEVFEFPPGTSRAQARSAVAALLRERARERIAAGQDRTPARQTRPAKPPTRVAAR
jgi:hypothetical protein